MTRHEALSKLNAIILAAGNSSRQALYRALPRLLPQAHLLLDFGSARQGLEEKRNSMTSLFSRGYGAIAGIPTPDAIDRSPAISLTARDSLVKAGELGEGAYNEALRWRKIGECKW